MQYKFRGQRIIDWEWIYGSLITWPSGEVEIVVFDSKKSANKYDVWPETVGMWTTFTDKQGNEIYADDIVKDEIEHIVKFGEYWQDGLVHTGFYLKAVESGLEGCFEKDDAKYLTIVSNIHEQNDARSIQGTHHMLHDPNVKQTEAAEGQEPVSTEATETQPETLPNSEEGTTEG